MPESVTFATGSAALGGSAQYALNTAAQTLVQYPDTTLTINGHTDNTGLMQSTIRFRNTAPKRLPTICRRAAWRLRA